MILDVSSFTSLLCCCDCFCLDDFRKVMNLFLELKVCPQNGQQKIIKQYQDARKPKSSGRLRTPSRNKLESLQTKLTDTEECVSNL